MALKRIHVAAFAAFFAIAPLAGAKLPPPPPLDEKGKAAAEEKKAKDAAAAEKAKADQAAAEDNAVLRLARDRLLGGRRDVKLASAAMQQGLLQIVRDFCNHSNALCADCKFPELVRNWKIGAT